MDKPLLNYSFFALCFTSLFFSNRSLLSKLTKIWEMGIYNHNPIHWFRPTFKPKPAFHFIWFLGILERGKNAFHFISLDHCLFYFFNSSERSLSMFCMFDALLSVLSFRFSTSNELLIVFEYCFPFSLHSSIFNLCPNRMIAVAYLIILLWFDSF